jgi:hypothetical protein
MKVALAAVLLFACAPLVAPAQSPGVPIYAEGRGAHPLAQLSKAAKKLRESGILLSAAKVKEQSKRTTCELSLPAASTKKLENREVWQHARQSHLRIGWLYLCTECDKWHLGLSGGYAITKNTAATCDHVVAPLEDMKEGYLVAADDDDNLFAVTEVLACNHALDTAIVRLNTDKLTPLPFTCDVQPGDTVYCFSDPVDRRGYFSQGMVNRFIKRPFLTSKDAKDDEDDDVEKTPVRSRSRASAHSKPSTVQTPTWLEVNTEWAPGSSGSAVLDVYGNVVGHVSEIESVLEDADPAAKRKPLGTMIIFHDAIAACNVLSLIKAPPPVAVAAKP